MSINTAPATFIRDAAAVRMRGHAHSSGAHECCGALFGRVIDGGRTIEDAIPAPNRSSDATRSYLIGPHELRRLELDAHVRGLDVVGFYHSHPTGTTAPSPMDVALAWPWYTYVIVAAGEAPRAWRLRADRTGFDPEAIEWLS